VDLVEEGEKDPPFPEAVSEVASRGEGFSEFNIWTPMPLNKKGQRSKTTLDNIRSTMPRHSIHPNCLPRKYADSHTLTVAMQKKCCLLTVLWAAQSILNPFTGFPDHEMRVRAWRTAMMRVFGAWPTL
jgi:hypothetical protein